MRSKLSAIAALMPSKPRPLGRPVARRAGAVFFAGDDDRAACLPFDTASPRRRSTSASCPARCTVTPPSVPGAKHVFQSNVGEGAAHHHFMIAAPRAVLIVILGQHVVVGEIARRRTVLLDGAGRRDMIRGDGIAEQCQHARAVDRSWVRAGVLRHALEIGRLAHVGRLHVPLEELAFAAPAFCSSARRLRWPGCILS